MSDVKLHKVSVGATAGKPDGWFRIIPATTAEIMDAHPKCVECRHVVVHHSNFGECFNKDNMEYDHQYDAYAAMNILDPYSHYCCHWEEKQ